jgi:hypothetical protein
MGTDTDSDVPLVLRRTQRKRTLSHDSDTSSDGHKGKKRLHSHTSGKGDPLEGKIS